MKVDIRREGETVHFQVADGLAGSVSIVEVRPAVYSVLLDGKSFEARLVKGNPSLSVSVNGISYDIQIVDPRAPRRTQTDFANHGRQTIIAPMPGKIVRVLVSEGQPVDVGTGLLVMEAMKMQNEIKAGKSGVVVSLPVRDGDAVSTGGVLAIVE